MGTFGTRRAKQFGLLAKGITAMSISVVGLVALAVDATPASAAPVSLTSATTVTGHQTLSSTGLSATSLDGLVGVSTDLVTSITWTQSASLATAFDNGLVRQGRTLSLADSF